MDSHAAAIITAIGVAVSALASVAAALIGRQTCQQARAIHTLVNSSMGNQLRLSAGQSKRLAEMTRDPADVELAKKAEALLRDHEARQAVVDRDSG